MDQQLYNTSNAQGRGTSLDSLFGQFSSAGLGAPPPGLMDQSGRRGGDSILGAPHQEYQPMEGNFSWTDNYSRFAAPHNFTAVETLMSELAPEDHFGGGDPHLTSILQQFLMKQQMPQQHGMPPSYIPDDLLMNTSAVGGNKPSGTGAGGNRSRGGSFHVKLENQQQQMAMLEQQQQQQMSHHQNHQNTQQSHLQGQQGQQMPQQGHNQGNPGDIYGALELLSAYLGTTPGQFPEPQGYPTQMGTGSTVGGQQSHLGDPYFDLLNGGGAQQPNPYQYMNPYYPDYLNFDPANTMKTNPHSAHNPHSGHSAHNTHNPHGTASNKPQNYQHQQAASHYMNAAGHPGAQTGYQAMDQQVQHELLQQLFKEDQQHNQHPGHQHQQHSRQYEDLTGNAHTHSQQQNQQQVRDTAVSQHQQGKQQRNAAPSAAPNNKATKNPANPANQGHMQHAQHQGQQQMNPAAASRRTHEGQQQQQHQQNMHGNKVPPAATTGKNDNKIPPPGYPPARMPAGPPGGKPGMMNMDWADALGSNDYLPESIKSLLPASVRDQLLKKSQEYYEYMRRGPKDAPTGGMHHGGLPIPASSTHLLQNFAANPRSLMSAGFPSMPPRRIGQLTAEERRNKIEKYLTKRKKRSWSKKISYDCRKRVADSRLRIKGRFVTKEQAVAVLGADEQMNLTEIKEMLVTKFGVAPMPRRRGSSQAINEGKAGKNAKNTADKHLDQQEDLAQDVQDGDLAEGEGEGEGEIEAEGPIAGLDMKENADNHEHILGNVPSSVNANEMRPEELESMDLEKNPLDSQHFDVLDTNKLIASVTNNVS